MTFSPTDLPLLMFIYLSPFSFIHKRGCLLLSYASSLRITWVKWRTLETIPERGQTERLLE